MTSRVPEPARPSPPPRPPAPQDLANRNRLDNLSRRVASLKPCNFSDRARRRPLFAVPELTRSAGIQLNERVSLQRRSKAIA
jgi:hypothetical protein